jgi:hypothetical protein
MEKAKPKLPGDLLVALMTWSRGSLEITPCRVLTGGRIEIGGMAVMLGKPSTSIKQFVRFVFPS